MTNEEILDRINGYLNQHLAGIRGYICKEPYIGDFFKLFAAAYANRGLDGPSVSCITSDSLVEDIGEPSHQADTPENYQKKLDLLRILGSMWSEWHSSRDSSFHCTASRQRQGSLSRATQGVGFRESEATRKGWAITASANAKFKAGKIMRRRAQLRTAELSGGKK